MEERKPLLRGVTGLFVAERQCLIRQTHELPKPARMMLRIGETEGMTNGVRELAGLLAQFQRLIRIAEMPQRECKITAVRDAGVLANLERP